MNIDQNRYHRQIRLSDIQKEGQIKLSQARVLIVGIGGLGCPAAQYLAAAGVGKIGLVDFDKVEITNLHRQVLFSEADLGKPKTLVAKKKLKKSNSSIEIIAFDQPFDEKSAIELIKDFGIVLDGTDNFQTKYLINDACILANKPFVSASIYKYQGQLSVFNFEDGPSYRCLYPDNKLKDDSNCEETGVLGVLPGILGTMQAAETLKMILGIGKILSGKLKIINTLDGTEQIITFEKNKEQFERVRQQGLVPQVATCRLGTNGTLYLDVREPHEQPQATNKRLIKIPLHKMSEKYPEIPRDKEVHVFCQSGIRSKKAIELLNKKYNFDNLVNVEGGINELLS